MFSLWFISIVLASPAQLRLQQQTVREIASYSEPIPMSIEEVSQLSSELWEKHKAEQQTADRVREVNEKRLEHEQSVMKYSIQFKGEKPANGYPLYIALHGGGGGPARMNDGQWQHMSTYYLNSVDVGVYVATRGITNNWNLHFDALSYPLYDRLIDNLILAQVVDPNRIYFIGFSAGGDGVYQIAPRMADRLAGANMSAGHPNGTSAVNLYTLPFLIQMGERDSAYNRNRVAAEYHRGLNELQESNPNGYIHDLFLHQGGGHNAPWRDNNPRSREYAVIKDPVGWLSDPQGHQQTRAVDSNAVRWLSKHARDPNPKHLIWQTSTRADTRGDRAQTHYWLQNTSEHQQIAVRVEDNTFVVERATQDFTILIDPDLVDLQRDVSVVYNDIVLFSGMVEPDLRLLAQGLLLRNDPNFAYVGAIEIDVPAVDQKQ